MKTARRSPKIRRVLLASNTIEESKMQDMLWMGIMAVLVALTLAYLRLCANA